ncbi:hypothetical protein ONZ45_g5270 [Pleurotus djamor]|nr:hypothetical protein ONZ45_g5270 [Pleurotus djamor]
MLSPQLNDDVAIFWDYENCTAASAISGYYLVHQIRSLAHSYGIIKSFKAYTEIEQIKAPALRAELQSSGVSVTDCPHLGKKDVVDKMMIVDMMAYAMDHPGPRTIMIISGDRDYAYAAAILRMRRFNVVVVSSGTTSGSLSAQASACHDWSADILGKAAFQDSPAVTNQRLPKDVDPFRAASPLPKLPTPSPEPLRPAMSGTPRSRRGTLSRVESTSKLAEEVHDHSFSSASSTQFIPSRGNSTDSVTFATNEKTHQRAASAPVFVPTRYNDEVVYDPPHPLYESKIPPTPGFPTMLPQTPNIGSSLRLHSSTPGPGSHHSSTNVLESPFTSNAELASVKGKEKESPSGILTAIHASPTQSLTGNATVSPPPPVVAPAPAQAPSPSPSPPVSSTSKTQTVHPQPQTTQTYQSPPPEFVSLIRLLEGHRKVGRTQPMRSIIACELSSADKSVYTRAGVAKFGQYIAMAESKNIVTTGGVNGGAWVSLVSKWHNSV